MGVLDEFESGPVEGLLPISMRDPDSLKLAPAEQVLLVQGVNSPFYQVLMKVFQGELEKLETSHFKTWRDKEAFERTGLLAVSARLFLERSEAEVKHQIEEFSADLDFIKKKQEVLKTSLEDQIREEFK
jgi:hypothetical protein